MFAKLVLLNGKLGVMCVVTSQLGLTRPSSIFFSLGLVRDIVPTIIDECSKCAFSVRFDYLPYIEKFGVFCLDLFDPSKWTLVYSATAKI